MSISVCIVDDDERAQKSLVQVLNKIPGITIVSIESDPVVAISKILSGKLKVDIVFSDLEMPDITGLELCNQIGQRAVVIFVTGHPAFALEAYQTDAADFITKPVVVKDVIRAIEKAKEKVLARYTSLTPSIERSIYLKIALRNRSRIRLKELLYIEVDGKYINLHVLNQNKISLKKSLNTFAEELPEDLFLRISKSCIVNKEMISTLVDNRMVLETGSVHYIGSTFMLEVYTWYDAHTSS